MTERKQQETVDARLRRLAGTTADIALPSGLAERLAAPYRAPGQRRPRGVASVVLPFGRPALLAAALAAAASITLAFQVERVADETVAQTEDGGWLDL